MLTNPRATPLLYEALQQLLHEVIEAGFDAATDYNWPKSIADARKAIAESERVLTDDLRLMLNPGLEKIKMAKDLTEE